MTRPWTGKFHLFSAISLPERKLNSILLPHFKRLWVDKGKAIFIVKVTVKVNAIQLS